MIASANGRPRPNDLTPWPSPAAHGRGDPKAGVGGASGEPDACVVTDFAGVILQADDDAAELLGVRREFLLGKPFPLYLTQALWPAAYTLLNRVRATFGCLNGWRARLRVWRDPAGLPVSLTVVPVLGEDHSFQLRWLILDLRRDTWTERALAAERALDADLMEAAPALVLILDDGGLIVRCNAHAVALAGRPAEELVGREWVRALLPPEERAAGLAALQRALAGQGVTFTAPLLTAGEPRTIFWSAKSAARPEGGRCVLALGQDITELRAAQQRALHAERLAAIGQVTAALAHESRNLLQSAQASLERLAWRLTDNPEALDLAQRARRSHQRLLRLFEDVRQYAAPLRLDLAPCSLPELWREAWESARAIFPDKPAELTEEVGEAVGLADRFRLHQVFRNIFENSLAAGTGEARVHVACRESQRAGRPGWRLSLRDNGPGLDAEQRRRIFEPFYTTRPRGTGLGMAIAGQIIQAHAGEIAVGGDGPGAEIILWLPRSAP